MRVLGQPGAFQVPPPRRSCCAGCWRTRGSTSPGRNYHFTLSWPVIGCHSVWIYILILLSLLLFSVKIEVSPRARQHGSCRGWSTKDVDQALAKLAAIGLGQSRAVRSFPCAPLLFIPYSKYISSRAACRNMSLRPVGRLDQRPALRAALAAEPCLEQTERLGRALARRPAAAPPAAAAAARVGLGRTVAL